MNKLPSSYAGGGIACSGPKVHCQMLRAIDVGETEDFIISRGLLSSFSGSRLRTGGHGC